MQTLLTGSPELSLILCCTTLGDKFSYLATRNYHSIIILKLWMRNYSNAIERIGMLLLR